MQLPRAGLARHAAAPHLELRGLRGGDRAMPSQLMRDSLGCTLPSNRELLAIST